MKCRLLYIERASVWHDFHKNMIPLIAERLGAQILPKYLLHIRDHLYIHKLPSTDSPARTSLPTSDTESLSFLEIRDRENNELVTVIELLSPTNKYAGPDREQYLAKARRLQRSWVHFVEIDLLRGGPRMPWLDMPPCDYCVVVSRYEQRPRAGIWPIKLRDRLPEIPIPLRHGDADARLDLQQALHHVHDAAGYRYHIYAGPPEPALSNEDAEWATAIATSAKT